MRLHVFTEELHIHSDLQDSFIYPADFFFIEFDVQVTVHRDKFL